MSAEAVKRIQSALKYVEWKYHRLILVAGGSAEKRTQILAALSEEVGTPHVFLGIALSKRLLDRTAEERRLHASDLFHRLLAETKGDVVCVDHIELLFEPTLSLDPLQLLKHHSRNKTLVVSWCGNVDVARRRAFYAVPDHPEYSEGGISDLYVVAAEHHAA